MHKCTCYGLEKIRTDAQCTHAEPCTSHTQRMHIYQTEVVPTMSRSLQAGSTEMQWNQDGKREL